jgi:hypothetical protein
MLEEQISELKLGAEKGEFAAMAAEFGTPVRRETLSSRLSIAPSTLRRQSVGGSKLAAVASATSAAAEKDDVKKRISQLQNNLDLTRQVNQNQVAKMKVSPSS